jgi:multiple sugar transport system substrate-binding protein
LKSQSIVGATDISAQQGQLEIYLRSIGKALYTAAGGPGFTADDAASWFAYWNGMRSSGACASAQLQASVTGSGPAQSLLVQKKVASSMIFSNQFSGYQKLSTDIYALTLPPFGTQTGLYYKPSMLMSVSAKCKNPDDAVKFAGFLVFNTPGAKALGLDRGIPGSAATLKGLASGLSSYDKTTVNFANLVTRLKAAGTKTTLDPKGASKIQTILTKVAQQVSFGQVSATAGGKSFYDQMAAALA